MLKIEHVKEIDAELGELIGDEFDKYASANGIDCNYEYFVFVAKEDNESVGIISGDVFYNEVHIENLIVKEGYRDKQIGSRLMNELDKYCQAKGFYSISVNTHRFQAPDFYKNHGFELDFTRENKKNPKLDRYFFVKYC